MVLQKHDYPILEFDDSHKAVIMPNHDGLDIKLPKKAVFGFLGDEIDNYAKKVGAKIVGEFVSATKIYLVYVIEFKGEQICLAQAPVGSAPATQFMDWLIGYGVREVISTGSCGALDHFDEGVFLVPYRALRDEGTSYHYVKPSRYIDINLKAMSAIEKTIKAFGLGYKEVMTWTTDGFYRETEAKINYRKEEGCQVVEMECSALAACAQLRQITFGQILYTADSLANVEQYDERNWGDDSIAFALELSLNAVIKL